MSLQLGNYLRELREEKKYSTRQLAEMADCSQSMVSAIENGDRLPHLLRLWSIIKPLGGDIRQGLYYLCLDLGIPDNEARQIIEGNHLGRS